MKNILLALVALIIILLVVHTTKTSKEENIPVQNPTEPMEEVNVALEDGVYTHNPESSELSWEGSALTKAHVGTLQFSEATLSVVNGKTSGSAVVDMNTIRGDAGEGLDGHLKNEDFFDVTSFPTARLEFNEDESGVYSATLEIKGITHDVDFTPTFTTSETGLILEEELTIDRTQWGITYNSKSLLDTAKDKAINDKINIRAKISFNK